MMPPSSKARRYKDRIAFGLCVVCIAIAVVPLVSILVEVVANGAPALSTEFLTSPPGVIGEAGGGIGNAIQGTLILMGLSSAIGVPVGVLAGIYLAEFGNNKLGHSLRFLNDVLAEFPSIVVGILAYSIIVATTNIGFSIGPFSIRFTTGLGSFSTIAGAIALSIIMLPVVTRTTEESIKLVPATIRDAAAALGIRKWRATVSVVLSTARGGVVTGVLLAVARITGETAPLILTVLGSNLFFTGLTHPVDALPLRIWRLALLPYDYAREQGWGAALVLIIIVLTLNVTVRLVTRGRYSMVRSRI